MKDGFHTISGYRVFVQDNAVRYALFNPGKANEEVKYIYRLVYRRPYYGDSSYTRCSALTPASFRYGVSAGLIRFA